MNDRTCWGVLVTFKNGVVNINEAYNTYELAKNAILKRIDIYDLKIIDDFNFYDLDNELHYELKCISIF